MSSCGIKESLLLGRRWRLDWDWVADWRVERSLVEVLDVLDAGRRERWEEKRLRRTDEVVALVTGGLRVGGAGAIVVGIRARGEGLGKSRFASSRPRSAMDPWMIADSNVRYIEVHRILEGSFALRTGACGYLPPDLKPKHRARSRATQFYKHDIAS